MRCPSARVRTFALAVCLALSPAFLAVGDAAVVIQAGTVGGGLTISGSHPSYSVSFGAVNGLGLGTPKSGLTILPNAPISMFYMTPVLLNISGIGSGQSGTVSAWLSTPFSSSVFSIAACAASACASAGQYFPLTTVPVVYSNVPSGTFSWYLAVVVSNGNGPQFPASDTAVVKVKLVNDYDSTTDSFTISLSPNVYTQSALSLTLASSGGLAISAGTDYGVGFGLVNGLGLSPGAGITTRSRTGGVLYTTPYRVTPQFAGFTQTTGTLSSWVSSPFAAATELYLLDSASSVGPWTTISTSSAAPTVMSGSAASGTAVIRYLALFVSSVNSAQAVPGSIAGGVAVNATQTFTLTVP